MTSGLIVRTTAFHGGVVLSDVEVKGPWAQLAGHGLQSFLHLVVVLPVKPLGQNRVFRGVVTQRVEEGVRHIRLETECFRPVYQLQQLNHAFPTVHSTPTDLAFGRQELAVTFSDIAALTKSRCDLLRSFGITCPSLGICGGINSDDTIRSDPQLCQRSRDPAGFPDLFYEALALLW